MSRLLFLLALSLVAFQPSSALAGKVHGALIPDEVKKLPDGRYESQKDWDKTLQFFGGQYNKQKHIVWRRLETTPKVSGHFIQNTAPKRTWDGILVYQAEGKIFISVLKTETPK